MIEYVLIGIGALAVGVISTLIVTRMISKARGNGIIEEAKLQAEKIKNEKIKLPSIPEDKKEHVFHIYPILVEDRENFINYMNKRLFSLNNYMIFESIYNI